MFIIAGLGNPDEKYQGTRHNVGFDVVDRLAEKYQIAVDTKKHRALIGKGVIEGQKVLLRYYSMNIVRHGDVLPMKILQIFFPQFKTRGFPIL